MSAIATTGRRRGSGRFFSTSSSVEMAVCCKMGAFSIMGVHTPSGHSADTLMPRSP